jgi:NADPH:quinone reductase
LIEQLESRNLRQGKAGVNDGVSPSYTLGKAHFSRSRRGQALTGGKGVDVVLDMVAGDYVPREMKALADDGRIVIIATLGGSKAAVDLMEVLRRRLTLTGSTLRPRSVEFKAEIARALREKVWPLVEAGRMSPIIYATFPLEHAAKAHALMESGEHIGKIVLTVQ